MSLNEYSLSENFFIKLIEFPALYNVKTDELYCIDEKALELLKEIEGVIPSKARNLLSDEKITEFIEFCLKEGILTDKPIRRLHPKIKQSPIPSLRYLELQITKRCNLRCKHCFVGDSSNTNLAFEKIVKILKEFEDMQGLRVLITGGEPLLHPEFDEINSIFPELALRKILFTNGILLNDVLLKKLNVQEIQISLDGMKQGHESLRGKGTFDKTLTAIKKAIDHGFQVSVATVIHKKNLQEFKTLDALIKSLPIKDWTVDALTLSGNLKFNQEFWVEPEVVGNIMKIYGFSKEEHPRLEGYGCGAHLIAVLATGKVAFCSFFEETPIGNIEEGLKKIWQRKKQILLKDLECSHINCPFLNECLGGCRYRAMTMSGNKNSKDLFKCYQMFPDSASTT